MEGHGRLLVVAGAALALVPVVYFLLHHNPWLTVLLGSLFASCFIGLVAAGIREGPVQRNRILALLLLFSANVLFFMFYEQAGASFNFLAERLVDRRLGDDWTFPTGWFQSLSPLAVIMLAPPIALAWGWLARRKLEPSIPHKFGIALLANALGFFVLAYALSHLVDARGLVPLWALVACYVLKTVGELHLVPVGLSIVTQLAPARMIGVTVGAWFLSISIGNSLAGWFSARISAAGGKSGLTIASALEGFTTSFWLLLGASLLMFVLAPLINRLMQDVK